MKVAAALSGARVEATDARVLLQHVLGVGHADLVAHPERVLDDAARRRYLELVERRRRGEPIAYLIGWREFYGRPFAVDASVLIPRPETELLVDAALERVRDPGRTSILDLGTGSGAVAITLALERAGVTLTATDASAAALRCAQANSSRLGARVEFLQGDWLAPVAGRRFDLIVSNPPYVAEGDPHLQAGDLRFEPRSALAAGPGGMDAIGAIVAGAQGCLDPGGWLVFEHGHDQAEASAALLAQAGFERIFMARDLARLPRVSGGRRPRGTRSIR